MLFFCASLLLAFFLFLLDWAGVDELLLLSPGGGAASSQKPPPEALLFELTAVLQGAGELVTRLEDPG